MQSDTDYQPRQSTQLLYCVGCLNRLEVYANSEAHDKLYTIQARISSSAILKLLRIKPLIETFAQILLPCIKDISYPSLSRQCASLLQTSPAYFFLYQDANSQQATINYTIKLLRNRGGINNFHPEPIKEKDFPVY